MEKQVLGLTLEDRSWRYNRIRKFIREQRLDAILVASPAWRDGNVGYIDGPYFRVGYGYAFSLFPGDGKPVLLAGVAERPYGMRQFSAFSQDHWVEDIRLFSVDQILSVINEFKLEKGKIGLTLNTLSADLYQRITNRFPDAELVDITREYTALKRVKSPGEIKLAKESARICDEAWEFNKEFIKPGVYDSEVTAEWERIMYRNLAGKTFNLLQNNPFDITCPCWTDFHSPKVISKGDMMVAEISCCFRGYWTQRVACYSLGEPNPTMVKLFNTINLALEKSAAIVKPGIKVSEMASLIDDVIANAGFLNPSQFHTGPHGHLMGVDLDEGTFSRKTDIILEEGFVFVIHPGAAISGWEPGKAGMFGPGGMFVVTKDGCEKLYGPDMELTVID
jgi:Xaa-Pro aminopeptidase